jgi:hypothetical protein
MLRLEEVVEALAAIAESGPSVDMNGVAHGELFGDLWYVLHPLACDLNGMSERVPSR